VTTAGSVEGREQVRLFCALPLPDAALDRLVGWQSRTLGGARGARPVPRGHLHVTLAFLGRRPAAEIDAIVGELRAAAAGARRGELVPRRYRETRSVGMVVLDDPTGASTRLAADLQQRLHGLGVYEPERREWLPHVTVLRFRERPRLGPPPPDFGAFSPSEAALYHSVLRPAGAQYEILEAVALGG
jgi:2'-5' RNA ligase